ncbi:hypothetical protein [Streptomyces sp. NPDC096153]|uniref:hypothetical protein n=1 Tax=Streptomyces sp. NPDC096153 TaxID=3155548 RepID=UPI00332EA5CD
MDETTGAPGASPEPAPAPALPADEPRGFLASALTPIAPAHPAADEADDETAGSSADYHAGEYEETEEAAAAQGNSVMRAFLLAAVERWRKGAGTAVKALEVEKAKAQARQTRTNHTISENRVGGTTTTNVNESKGNKDAKSANSRTHAVNNANQAKSSRDDKNASNRNRDDKNHRQNQGKTSRDDKTSSNKDDKTSSNRNRDDKNSSAKNSSAKTSKDDKNHDTDTNADSRSAKFSNDSKNSGDSKTAGDSKSTKGDQGTTTVHDGEGGGALAPNRKTDLKTGKPTDSKDQRPGAADAEQGKAQGQPGQKPSGQQSPQPADTTPAATDTRPRTQDAREAGYRDGHRAARGVAQVRAYVDGTRDGYADGTEQATKEKAQLDEARDERKQQRADAQRNPQQINTNGEQQPVSGTNNVVPITVKGIDKENVYLGEGAARESMTRGEVRSLKTFERRLKARSSQMIKAADVLKALVAYEKEQARQALALVEKAKSVKGGEKLIPKLQRMAEAAKQEAAAAEEAHKQAVRAAESVKVLLANVEKRDGLIYKAVVDSPETMPAEMAFYKETA